MSMILSEHAPLRVLVVDRARGWLARTPRSARALLAAGVALMAAYQISILLQSPADAIRRALTAAAEETRGLPWSRSPQEVEAVVARHFGGHLIKVDATRFPAEVSVALGPLDRATCIEARSVARRIEGPVVVALDGYRSAADCQDRNIMVWRILP